MTAQDFHQFLESPELLAELPLTELQQLALRYPYSPNLRLLLLLKTKLDQHPRQAAYLERCAAASFDRAFIYDLLQELESAESGLAAGDILELRELDEIAPEPIEIPASPAPISLSDAPPPAASVSLPPEEEVLPAFIHETEDTGSAQPPTLPQDDFAADPVPTTPASPAFLDNWVDKAVAFQRSLPPTPAAPPAARDVAPSNRPEEGQSLVSGSASPSLRQRLERIRRQQMKRQSSGREEVDKIARRSLVAHDAVASETLAQLLVRQEQYQHAIKMYRRLILLYPEKKTIFAGLIKDLKEKL